MCAIDPAHVVVMCSIWSSSPQVRQLLSILGGDFRLLKRCQGETNN